MRKKALFICLCFIFTLTACGNSERIKEDIPEKTEEERSLDIAESKTEITGQDNGGVPETVRQKEVSTEEKVITCQSETAFFGASAAGTEYAYVCREDGRSIYQMNIKEEEMQELSLDIPKEMEVSLMTVDADEDLHILFVTSQEYLTEGKNRKFEIWKIDRQGNVRNKADLTEIAEGSSLSITDFQVDGEGRYYIKWAAAIGSVVIADSEGQCLYKLSNEDLNIEGRRTFGRGKDGRMYILFRREGVDMIGVLNGETGCIEEVYSDVLPMEDDGVVSIAGGTDTDILYFSHATGLWAYNLNEGQARQRKKLSELQTPYDASEYNKIVLGWHLLLDGRLMIIDTLADGDSNILQFCLFAGGK